MEYVIQKRWLSLLCVPAVLLLFLIIKNSVNTPYWDEWEIVTLFQHHVMHTLTFQDFWVQHNEHRILFPNLLLFCSALLTHWNTRLELIFNFLFACLAFVLLMDMIRHIRVIRSNVQIAIGIVCACLFFSPISWNNWLWGWQVEWYMNLFGVVATIWALCYWPRRWPDKLQLPFAILTAILATFSLANGQLIWIIGLGILLLQRAGLQQIIVWITTAAVVFSAFYYRYSIGAGEPSKTLAVHIPFKFGAYLLTYIGNPLGWSRTSDLCIGLILSSVIVFILWQWWHTPKLIHQTPGWFALAFYAAGSALTTGLSRVGFGVIEATSSRYITISLLLTLSIVIISTIIIERHKWFSECSILLCLSVLSTIIVANYVPGIHAMQQYKQKLTAIQSCTRQNNPSDTCLLSTYPNVSLVRERLIFLKNEHMGGY